MSFAPWLHLRSVQFGAEYQQRIVRQGSLAPLVRQTLVIPSRTAQRGQSDAGGIKAAIDGKNLAGDVTCALAAQKKYRLRQLFLEAITIERDRVVIVGADFRRVDRFGHGRVHRTRRNGVDA